MTLYVPSYLETQQYSALRVRQVLLDSALQEGAVGATDLAVTQRGAGANMSVDVAIGSAFIKGDTTARQGLYHTYSDAVANLAISSNSSGNPRLDQIVLQVNDSTDGLGGSDNAQLLVLTGTPTSGATIDNRTGAASLPASAMLLGDVLVANAAASITNSVIRDRRPWSKGALWVSNSTSGFTTTSTTHANINAAFVARLEVSAPQVVVAYSVKTSHSVANARGAFQMFMDGVALTTESVHTNSATATNQSTHDFRHVVAPTAGTHLFELRFRTVDAGTLTAASTFLAVQELLASSGTNGAS